MKLNWTKIQMKRDTVTFTDFPSIYTNDHLRTIMFSNQYRIQVMMKTVLESLDGNEIIMLKSLYVSRIRKESLYDKRRNITKEEVRRYCVY